MRNNYNPWRVSTFTLLLLLSVSVGFAGKIEHYDMAKSFLGAIVLAGCVLLVQLPDLIMSRMKGKHNER